MAAWMQALRLRRLKETLALYLNDECLTLNFAHFLFFWRLPAHV